MIYLWLTLSMMIGLFLVFGVKPSDFVFRKNPTLKSRFSQITGKRKLNFLLRAFLETREILELTDRKEKYKSICTLSLLFSLAGVLISMLINNLLLLPVLAIGFLFIPLWYIKITLGSYKKHVNAELETALSSITTSYLRSYDIIQAVRENKEQLRPPVVRFFQKFLTETEFVSSNVSRAIQNMKLGCNNYLFHEWCDILSQCQNNKTYAPALLTTVGKFSDVRSLQADLDSAIYTPLKECITMAVMLIANVPLMYFINRDWFMTLTHNILGKTVLTITAGVIFVSIAKVIKLVKPVEWKG